LSAHGIDVMKIKEYAEFIRGNTEQEPEDVTNEDLESFRKMKEVLNGKPG